MWRSRCLQLRNIEQTCSSEVFYSSFWYGMRASRQSPKRNLALEASLLCWVREQQESEGMAHGEDVYIVLRLDGRVRKSGRGMPEWVDIVNELAPLDTFVSKLEK